ncbi:hypothetical protein EVAR_34212_1 [Eumeta japonica]|uniref:Uncharacterized protein n=1 Tax=Eumeta variegata TaxID=151549 RepID=A0A4C1WKR9_EUMVA|nr:hypothetical protein EVAR_34212_1 [Eumeta japonica]
MSRSHRLLKTRNRWGTKVLEWRPRTERRSAGERTIWSKSRASASCGWPMIVRRNRSGSILSARWSIARANVTRHEVSEVIRVVRKLIPAPLYNSSATRMCAVSYSIAQSFNSIKPL